MEERYSPYWSDALGVSYGELLALVRHRVEELERELWLWRQLLELLEGGSGWRPGEKPEEVRVGRVRVAGIYRGDGYVRMVPSQWISDVPDVRAYLEGVLAEIRELQARGDAPALARLEVKQGPDGSIAEVIYQSTHSSRAPQGESCTQARRPPRLGDNQGPEEERGLRAMVRVEVRGNLLRCIGDGWSVEIEFEIEVGNEAATEICRRIEKRIGG